MTNPGPSSRLDTSALVVTGGFVIAGLSFRCSIAPKASFTRVIGAVSYILIALLWRAIVPPRGAERLTTAPQSNTGA